MATRPVHLAMQPSWFGTAGVQNRIRFNWASGYKFDFHLPDLANIVSAPQDGWTLPSQLAGAHPATAFRVVSHLDGMVNYYDLPGVTQSVALGNDFQVACIRWFRLGKSWQDYQIQ